MITDVSLIKPCFCARFCHFYCSQYAPDEVDFEMLHVSGNCLYSDYAFPCQLLDLDNCNIVKNTMPPSGDDLPF